MFPELLLITALAGGCQSVPQAQHIAFVGLDDDADVYESPQVAKAPEGGPEQVFQFKGEDCTLRMFAIRFGPAPTCQRALQQARGEEWNIRLVRNFACTEQHNFIKQCMVVTGWGHQ